MLSIALPKGRLGDKTYALFKKIGLSSEAMENVGRKLIIDDEEKGLRYLLVKPSDVSVYVEKGAADIGVVGKDILEETGSDVFELMDLGFGKCTMCVAARDTYEERPDRKLRVATKFEHIARKYYQAKGREAEFIHLNGSIELAPVLNIADVIVDIVETGTTLKDNHLVIVDRFLPISARLIANKASLRFKQEKIHWILNQLHSAIQS